MSYSWAYYELALSLHIKRRMDYGKEYYNPRGKNRNMKQLQISAEIKLSTELCGNNNCHWTL